MSKMLRVPRKCRSWDSMDQLGFVTGNWEVGGASFCGRLDCVYLSLSSPLLRHFISPMWKSD